MAPWSADNDSNGCHDCGAFLLDVVGRFDAQHVRVQWSDSRRPTNEHVEQAIEEVWQQQVELAALHGKALYDGRLCRLISCEASDGELRLVLGEVSYREFVGTNLTNARLRYLHGPEVLADPLGVSAALETADGFLLLGRRSRRVFAHPGQIHPISGIMQPSEAPGSVPSPFRAIARELREELNLPGEAILETVCLGLVRDKGIVQPEMIFDVRVGWNVQAVRRAAAGAADGGEHEELLTLRDHPAGVMGFLEKHSGQLTSVAVATLLMHGQRRWGTGWFATARGYLPDLV